MTPPHPHFDDADARLRSGRAAVVRLVGIVLVASALVGAEASGAPAAGNERGRAAPSARGASPPAGAESGSRDREARKKDPDQDVIDHLDQLEHLELLQNLDLFDTAAKRK